MIDINAKALLDAVDFLFIAEKSNGNDNLYMNQVYLTVEKGIFQAFRYGASVTKHSPYIECDKADIDMSCQVDYGVFKAIIGKIAQRHESVTLILVNSDVEGGDTLEIQAGNLKTSLKVSMFSAPSDVELTEKDEICVDVKDLDRIIKNSKIASGKNDVRHCLNGVLLETDEKGVLRAIATDGHRMAVAKCQYLSHQYTKHLLIISNDGVRYMESLIKMCDSENLLLHFNNRYLCADLPNGIMLKMQVLEGQFPDWRRAIPLNTETNMIVEKQQMLDSIQAAASLSNPMFRAGRFRSNDDVQLEIETNSELGQYYDAVEMKHFDGEQIDLGMNLNYLTMALSVVEDDEVHFGFNGSSGGIKIQGASNQTGIQVLMPVRL